MVKKQINNVKKKFKDDKLQKNKDIKPKKFTLKVSSKMKKKLKFTNSKLNIDKLKIKKVISHLIKEEPPIIKESDDEGEKNEINNEINGEGGVPLYLYITLKKGLKEDELKLIKLANSRIDIITKDELKNNIKNIKNIDLENQYQIFISNMKNNIYLNKKWDIIYYQSNKFEIIYNLIDKIINGATVIKLLDKKSNILKIKFGYTNMNIMELEDNAYRTILKTISFCLSNSEKYNGVSNILIKTKKSIPFNIFGEINAENINSYNS